MDQHMGNWMQMNASANRGTEAASSCPERFRGRESRFALTLILDTMVMVSIFAILGAAEAVLAAVLLLAGVLQIMLARICQAGAPKRRLLSI